MVRATANTYFRSADPSSSGGEGDHHPSELVLWDYCDAGTLRSLIDRPPADCRPRARGFLPESLCWHVFRSLLSALAWLHDGYRVDDYTDPRSGFAPKRGEWVVDCDWMPILHRDLRPENVYFQYRRSRETYGLCKLGFFGECSVSGHANMRSGGAVVAGGPGQDTELATLRERMAVDNIYTVPKVRSRPGKGFVLLVEGLSV